MTEKLKFFKSVFHRDEISRVHDGYRMFDDGRCDALTWVPTYETPLAIATDKLRGTRI